MRFLISVGVYASLLAGAASAAEPAKPCPTFADKKPDGLVPPETCGPPALPAPTGEMRPPRADPRHPLTQPPYPSGAKAAHEMGTVLMELTVDEKGNVTKAELSVSSGFARLDQAALAHVKRAWKFLPGTVNGEPATTTGKFKVVFAPPRE